MAKFAIIRSDDSIDVAEGTSIEDVTWRYGAPGNGRIEEFAGQSPIRHTFISPEHQRDLLGDTSLPVEASSPSSTTTVEAARAAAGSIRLA